MNIIPEPNTITPRKGAFVLSKNCGISENPSEIVANLNEFVQTYCGFTLKAGNDIILQIVDEKTLGNEGYILNIQQNSIYISAQKENGLFYGIQTLKQLIAEYTNNSCCKIPVVEIRDTPRFEYRSYMLDCCRHFFNVEFIKKMIDVCSLIKLNKFHWHLTEDQGWRIEIEKYPKLTTVGSIRKETRGDGIPVSGYYTKEQIRDVIAYASKRFIDIVPEFDVPGHTMAAIAAYPELSCTGNPVEVETYFGIKDTILCAGKNTTYEFVKDVLTEIADLFPYKLVHIGGDEAIKNHWRLCPDCRKAIANNHLKDEEELQAYFTEKIVAILTSLGKIPIVWNEAANSTKLNSNCILQYWRDGSDDAHVKRELKQGRKTIISKFTPYYLDYAHGMHPLRNVYEFNPLIVPEGFATGAENIIGVEAPLWTEYVLTEEKATKMTFPRLLAVAETGWTFAQNKNLKAFKQKLPIFNAILAQKQIAYTSVKKSDVNKFIGMIQTVRFFMHAWDKKSLVDGIKANKEVKKAAKIHASK